MESDADSKHDAQSELAMRDAYVARAYTVFNALLEKVLVKVLGGSRVKFDINGDEKWSNHPYP